MVVVFDASWKGALVLLLENYSFAGHTEEERVPGLDHRQEEAEFRWKRRLWRQLL